MESQKAAAAVKASLIIQHFSPSGKKVQMLADGSRAYVHRMVRAGEIQQGMGCFVVLPGYITPPVRWGAPGLWEKKKTWVLVHHCVRAYIHSLTVNGHCHICYVLW